jgi:hypothetical protein
MLPLYTVQLLEFKSYVELLTTLYETYLLIDTTWHLIIKESRQNRGYGCRFLSLTSVLQCYNYKFRLVVPFLFISYEKTNNNNYLTY